MDEQRRVDHFDRIIGSIDGLPDVVKARPSTVTTVQPIIGNSQTYVVQTYKERDGGFVIFLQMLDSERQARIAIPAKVAQAIYRQRDALVKRSRSNAQRDRWDRMTDDERDAQVRKLRGPRKAG